jgi:hypothetical protein
MKSSIRQSVAPIAARVPLSLFQKNRLYLRFKELEVQCSLFVRSGTNGRCRAMFFCRGFSRRGRFPVGSDMKGTDGNEKQ